MSETVVDLIDTHCHLTTAAADDLPAIFERASACGVRRMVCVGAGDGLEMARGAIDLASKFDHVWATIGIHPHDAGKYTTLAELEPLICHPKVVAIGETGLDFYRDWSPLDKQYELFRNTIAVARRVRKPLVIHCRDAEAECLEVLRECGAEKVGGVFHCYAGNSSFAAKIRELNFLVSFTGNITFKKAVELRNAVREIPLEQIMVETDMPYMAPEPFRGGKSEPKHVYQIALRISETKNVSLAEVARVTTRNAELLFGLSS